MAVLCSEADYDVFSVMNDSLVFMNLGLKNIVIILVTISVQDWVPFSKISSLALPLAFLYYLLGTWPLET